MTRPERKRFYTVVYAIGFAVFFMVVWGSMTTHFQASGPPTTPGGGTTGSLTQHFGLLRYASYERTGVDLRGQAVSGAATRDWTIYPLPLATTLFGTIFVGILCRYGYKRHVEVGRLEGRCDECGYPLRGLRDDRCPECGEATRT